MARLEYHVYKEQKKLRCGYTTGTCAAAAVQGAVMLLMTGSLPEQIAVKLENGYHFSLPVWVDKERPWEAAGDLKGWEETDAAGVRLSSNEEFAAAGFRGCVTRKDSGDDPDITDGILVYAYVRQLSSVQAEEALQRKRLFYEKQGGITLLLDGGYGVGRITGEGFEAPPGYAAINKGPRKQIFQTAQRTCRECGFTGILDIRIVIPAGERLADQTLNPALGITGGISVLGTTGVVEPVSRRAIVDTIRLQIRAALASGQKILLMTPGNYGQEYVKTQLGLSLEHAVKCGNEIGEAIDLAAFQGAQGLLLVGDIGKLVKLAAGIFQTHSRQADGRMEILGVHAALCGAGQQITAQIMDCATTGQALLLLQKNGLLSSVMESVSGRLERRILERGGGMRIGVFLFAKEFGLLGTAGEAWKLLEERNNGL